jgi:hypothetical protein
MTSPDEDPVEHAPPGPNAPGVPPGDEQAQPEDTEATTAQDVERRPRRPPAADYEYRSL